MTMREKLRQELSGRLLVAMVADDMDDVGPYFKRLLVWRVVDQLPSHCDIKSARRDLFSPDTIEQRVYDGIRWIGTKVHETLDIPGNGDMCHELACSILLGVMMMDEPGCDDGRGDFTEVRRASL